MKQTILKAVVILTVALLYGAFCRVAFALDLFEGQLAIVSLSFLLAVPFSFGALTTFLGYKLMGKSKFWVLGAPPIVTAIGMIFSIITQLEALLCVVVAFPVMLPCAMLGGMFISFFLNKRSGKLPVSLLVLFPFAISPIEQMWESPQVEASVVDTIEIKASPEAVWKQIVSVPAISEDELPSQWIYLLDFPKPISAEIDYHGVGAKRLAIFERDVTFFEVVTEYEPLKRLGFTIEADPKFVPHTAFDQHIIVGGRFYDVLDGVYEIEPTQNGCKLILTSNHRLSTPFNAYTGWWSEWTMNQVQGSILSVIKKRAEADSAL